MKQKYKNPPKTATFLITILMNDAAQYTALGDYEEEYNTTFQKHGSFIAWVQYWSKIIGLLPFFFIEHLRWSLTMISSYIKIAVRNLLRQKAYSIINIAGLTSGIACFILILFFVQYEFSYESHNPEARSVYHLWVEHHRENGEVDPVNATPVPLAQTLAQEVPEVTNFNRFTSVPTSLVTFKEKRFYQSGMSFADPGALSLFGFQMVSGDAASALREPFSAVITQEMANKYFESEDPVGQSLDIGGNMSVMVRGVMEKAPKASAFDPKILISFTSVPELFGQIVMNDWITNQIDSYIQVTPGTDMEALEEKINAVFQKYAPENVVKIKFESLDRLHLYSPVTGSGDIGVVELFLGVGMLILITACINYMNLSTARSSKRAKEVGIRKVVGADRGQLIRQFLGESYFYTAVSMALGLILAICLLPALSTLTGQSLNAKSLGEVEIVLTLTGLFLFIGFISGSYPALALSAFHPALTIKSAVHSGKKGARFRKILVLSQFTLSIMLIIATFLLGKQIDFMRNRALGFDKDQIVVIRNRGRIQDIEPLKNELLKDPRVVSVCGSRMLPSRIGMYNTVTWEGAPEGETISMIHNAVDWDFLETFDIQTVAGRGFSRNFPADVLNNENRQSAGGILINETAARRFGWDDPIGKTVTNVHGNNRFNYRVVGVIKDFHFSSLRNHIAPLKIFLYPSDMRYISVKVRAGAMDNIVENMETTWTRLFPNMPFDYFFFDTVFASQYQDEQRLLTLFQTFSLLAVFISCLGLLGLSAFAAEQRTKEMGVRKVLGASMTGLSLLLSREFTRWVLIANFVAWPIIWFAAGAWLKKFAYRIELMDHWALFLLAGLAALVIAWLTVLFQAIRVAWRNPVESLRYE